MDNVVVLFPRNRTQENSQTSQATANQVLSTTLADQGSSSSNSGSTEKSDFQIIAERNAALREKLKKEREAANKAVLKSYRIK